MKLKYGLRSWLLYSSVVLISCGLLAAVLRLWQADLRIPFLYSGDTLWASMTIKTIIETGWHLTNPSLGAPFGAQYYDWMASDGLHLLVIKFLTLFSSNWAVVLNMFYLLMFPLTAVCALFVFRRFTLSIPAASALSILYAFLPFHFFRGEAHLFLAAYYLVPFMVLIADWIVAGALLSKSRGWAALRSRRLLLAVVLCLMMSSSGVYYAYFSCFLFAVASVMVLLGAREARWKKLAGAGLLISVMILGVVLNVLPKYLNAGDSGASGLMTVRRSAESEVYGLKISQLLLPVTDHRLPYLADIKMNYSWRFPLVNENDSASLGLLGSLGFLTLLGWSVFGMVRRKGPGSKSLLFDRLAAFNLSALLLATIGGFAVVASMTVLPQIRAYNRISIFIAFYSLLALGLVIETLISRIRKLRLRSLTLWAVSILLVIIGVCDQTPRDPLGQGISYGAVKEAFTGDQTFVREIEAVMPADALIYQLPYMSFPENGAQKELLDYELFKPYLHSTQLRWSYGGLRGGRSDLWNRQAAQKPVDQMLSDLVSAGFQGISIDRAGYDEQEASVLEAQLSAALGQELLVSTDGRTAFYSLTAYSLMVRAL